MEYNALEPYNQWSNLRLPETALFEDDDYDAAALEEYIQRPTNALLPSALAPSRTPSNLIGSSSRMLLNTLPALHHWEEETVQTWYTAQRRFGSTIIDKMQLRKSHQSPYYHEYIVVVTRGGAIYRFDRMPDPNTPFNAIMKEGSTAYDMVQRMENVSFDESSVCVEFHWRGKQAVDLALLLSVCFEAQKNETTKRYTLQRYNCYFLAWTIVITIIQTHLAQGPMVHQLRWEQASTWKLPRKRSLPMRRGQEVDDSLRRYMEYELKQTKARTETLQEEVGALRERIEVPLLRKEALQAALQRKEGVKRKLEREREREQKLAQALAPAPARDMVMRQTLKQVLLRALGHAEGQEVNIELALELELKRELKRELRQVREMALKGSQEWVRKLEGEREREVRRQLSSQKWDSPWRAKHGGGMREWDWVPEGLLELEVQRERELELEQEEKEGQDQKRVQVEQWMQTLAFLQQRQLELERQQERDLEAELSRVREHSLSLCINNFVSHHHYTFNNYL
jgi:hypothetical protein